jgi:hypothetical protein
VIARGWGSSGGVLVLVGVLVDTKTLSAMSYLLADVASRAATKRVCCPDESPLVEY